MEPQPAEDKYIAEEQGDGTPVCIRCFRPVHPLNHYCPHCGEAVGQFTQYIPFLNLRWQVSVWVRMWQQVWSRNVSVLGRLFRLFMIIWQFPIVLLVGLPFKIIEKVKKKSRPHDIESGRRQNPGSSFN
jgi:hypothetical protein